MVAITIFRSCFLWLVLTISYCHTAAKEPFNSLPALFFFFFLKVSGFRKDFRDGLVQRWTSSAKLTSYGNPVHTELTGLCSNICRWGKYLLPSQADNSLCEQPTSSKFFFKLCRNLFICIHYRSQLYPTQSMPTCSATTPTPAPKGRKGEMLTSPQSSLVQADLCPRDDSQSPSFIWWCSPKVSGTEPWSLLPCPSQDSLQSSYSLVSTGNLVQDSITELFSQVML